MKNHNFSSAHTEQDNSNTQGGVIAVNRALGVLEAFGLGDVRLSLTELTRRTQLHKTTVLRLARTLAQKHYLVQEPSGEWRLGWACAWLGARYQAAFRMQDAVEPILRELAQKTGESVSLYVREGEVRVCLCRVESLQPIRHHVRVGSALPLDLGAPGRVILAFSGQAGQLYSDIRQQGFHISLGERDPEVSSVAAPVLGFAGKAMGAVCISGPKFRLTQAVLQSYAHLIQDGAKQVANALPKAH